MESPFVQDNYLRLNSLIEKAVPPVVTKVFKKYFQDPFQQSKILQHYAVELEAMKTAHIISAFQFKMIFPFVGMCILSWYIYICIYISNIKFMCMRLKNWDKSEVHPPFHSYGTNTHTFYTLRLCKLILCLSCRIITLLYRRLYFELNFRNHPLITPLDIFCKQKMNLIYN